MKQVRIVAVLTLTVLLAGCASSGGNKTDYAGCLSEPDRKLRVLFCTRAIDSGTLQNDALITAYVQRGDAYGAMQRPSMAESNYATARSLDPSDGKLVYLVGQAQFNQGDYDKALVTLTEALELNPNQPKAHDLLGWVLSDRRDYEGAIDQFSMGIALDPQDPDNLYGRALTQMRLYRFDQAAADFQKAIDVDPEFPMAPLVYAELHVYTGDFDRALALYDSLADKYSGDMVLDRRCWVLAAIGNVEDALPYCEEGIEQFNKSSAAFERAAYAALRAGDIDTAIAHYQTAFSLSEGYWWSDARARYGYAAALRLAGDTAGADRELALALEADPRIEERMQHLPHVPAGEV